MNGKETEAGIRCAQALSHRAQDGRDSGCTALGRVSASAPCRGCRHTPVLSLWIQSRPAFYLPRPRPHKDDGWGRAGVGPAPSGPECALIPLPPGQPPIPARSVAHRCPPHGPIKGPRPALVTAADPASHAGTLHSLPDGPGPWSYSSGHNGTLLLVV